MDTVHVYIDWDLEENKKYFQKRIDGFLVGETKSVIEFRNCPTNAEIKQIISSTECFHLEWEEVDSKIWFISDWNKGKQIFYIKPIEIESLFDVDWNYEAYITDYNWW